MKERILTFHCAKPVMQGSEILYNTNGKAIKHRPTHTLVFKYHKDENSFKEYLFMGWAACHSNDDYNKKLGRKIATERMKKIQNEFVNKHLFKVIGSIDDMNLPSNIKNDIEYYIHRAINISCKETNDAVSVVYRGLHNNYILDF